LVLDPFSGTFTTSYVAKLLGRRTIGIELQEEYIKIGLRRLGLASEYKGVMLEKVNKVYKSIAAESHQPTLFFQ
jgi:site-specific DNA-methyltransferase (adenine-specific)